MGVFSISAKIEARRFAEEVLARPGLSEQETRDLITREAETLFLRFGYRKTTIADIARACDFSTANVHRVFGTKADINEAIAARLLSGIAENARLASRRRRSAVKSFELFVRSVHDETDRMFTDRPEMHEMAVAAIDEGWRAIRRYRQELNAILTEIIERGIKQEEFNVHDVQATVRGVSMALKRVFHPLLIAEMARFPDEGEIDDLLKLILRSLRA